MILSYTNVLYCLCYSDNMIVCCIGCAAQAGGQTIVLCVCVYFVCLFDDLIIWGLLFLYYCIFNTIFQLFRDMQLFE